MKKIEIEITDEEYEGLKELAKEKSELLTNVYEFKYVVKVEDILTQFVSDITRSERSAGSDERYISEQWFDRSTF